MLVEEVDGVEVATEGRGGVIAAGDPLIWLLMLIINGELEFDEPLLVMVWLVDVFEVEATVLEPEPVLVAASEAGDLESASEAVET